MLLQLLCVGVAGAAGVARRALLSRAVAATTAGLAGLEGYMRAPLPLGPYDPWGALAASLPPTPPHSLVLLFPGLGGPDANSAAVADALRRAGNGALVVEFDWRQWMGGELRSATNGRRLGTRLGRELAVWAGGGTPGSLLSVHFIGISVGSHAANAACNAFADGCERVGASSWLASTPPHRRLTLLDPFTASGLVGLAVEPRAYGVLRFGALRYPLHGKQPAMGNQARHRYHPLPSYGCYGYALAQHPPSFPFVALCVR